jgi:hypothetical protein
MDMMLDNPEHFSNSSAFYNRMLSIGSTFIDNKRGGRAETIYGNHAVTINGEVKYYIPKNIEGNRGGIHYFTFDGLDQLIAHAEDINDRQSEASKRLHGAKVKVEFLYALFEFVKEHHSLCQELRWIGESAEEFVSPTTQLIEQDMEVQEIVVRVEKLKSYVNGSSNFFEVASFSADNISSNRNSSVHHFQCTKKF